MSGERISYRAEKVDHYGWLTRMGTAVWDIPTAIYLNDPVQKDRKVEVTRISEEEEIFQEMSSFLGKPSFDVARYLWGKFAKDFPGIGAAGGIFYYYYREPDNPTPVTRRDTVVFPIEVALNPTLLSWDFIARKQQELEKAWGLQPVSFGVNGSLITPFEFGLLRDGFYDTGELGELWFRGKNEIRLLQKPEYFLAFADLDLKVPDEELLSISDQLGSPFWVAETTRGYHLIFPLKFKTFSGPITRDDEVRARIGLVTSEAPHR